MNTAYPIHCMLIWVLSTVHYISSNSCHYTHYWCEKSGDGLTYTDQTFTVVTTSDFPQCLKQCDKNTTCKAFQYDSTKGECCFSSYLNSDSVPYLTASVTYDTFWKTPLLANCYRTIISQGMYKLCILFLLMRSHKRLRYSVSSHFA